MKSNKMLHIILLLLFSSIQVYAQSSSLEKDSVVSLTVEEAVDLGLSKNKIIKAGELSTLKSQYATKEVQSNLYPQVSAAASYTRNVKPIIFYFPKVEIAPTGEPIFNNSQMMSLDASLKNYFNGIIDMRLPLFNQELKESIQLSKLSTELTQADREVNQWELADEIRKAYYNIWLAELNKELIEKTIERTNHTLKDSHILYKNGMGLASDTLNAYINVQAQKSNLYMVENQVAQAKYYLKDMLGLPLETTLILNDTVNEGFLSQQLWEEQSNSSFSDRPDIKQNRTQQILAEKQINLDKSRKIPSLDFISQYQVQAQADNFKFSQYNWPQSFYVGIQLNIHIFERFKNNYKAKQSSIALQELQLAEQQISDKALLEYKKSEGDFTEAISRMHLNKDIIKAAEKSLNLVYDRYQKGVGRYQDVLDAQFNVIQFKNAYNKSIYDAYLALAAKKKALGAIK